jgi:hypothetical protein
VSLRALDVKTELDELLINLEWASRVKPNTQSNLALARLIRRPSVLDLLERLVRDERERQA